MAFIKAKSFTIFLFLGLFSIISCDKKDDPNPTDILQLSSAKVGVSSILGEDPVPPDNQIVLVFSKAVDVASADNSIDITSVDEELSYDISYSDQNKIITLTLDNTLLEGNSYTLNIPSSVRGINGEKFAGIAISFSTSSVPLEIISLAHNDKELQLNFNNPNIEYQPTFTLNLSDEITTEAITNNLVIVGSKPYSFNVNQLSNTTFEIKVNEAIPYLEKFNILVNSGLGDSINRPFTTVSYKLYTGVGDIPVKPIISDEELMTLVQEQTFKYFWDFGHPVSGLARERSSSGETVTSGGSGFGLMAMIVAVERGFITREQALERWTKIINFLGNADRFHGAWSHWLNGSTGKVIPFSPNDNGGDLVETAFLAQGLLTVRQYLNENIPLEKSLQDKITSLWEGIEWNWYLKENENYLLWHWSPNYGFEKNLRISGHNETQIVYCLAAASPTFGIEKEVYTTGYTRNGDFKNGNTFYGISLPAGYSKGGPLFFSHYSYLGMDPRNLEDEYINYWTQNTNHTKINREHCIDNPNNYIGYSEACWGLTASDNHMGYSAHSPTNDKGVITPTAALSSIPYTPEESLDAMKHFYFYLGDKLWGEYGFYDAFNPTEGWTSNSYLAIDQGPIICMIENYRTGLLWDLYISTPEVQQGLIKLGFSF